MKQYKMNTLNQVFNTISDGNVENMMAVFYEESDGPLIAFYNHVTGNGNRMFIFKNSVALLSAQKVYKFSYDELAIELEQYSFLKGFFFGSHVIHLKEKNQGPEKAKPIIFNVGVVTTMNGVQSAMFDKKATLAFVPFLKNLQTILPQLDNDFLVKYVITAIPDNKGQVKLKPYRQIACQEFLLFEKNTLYIVNEEILKIEKENIKSVELLTVKAFLSTTKYLQITENSGEKTTFSLYKQGNPDTEQMDAFCKEFNIWVNK